MTDHQPRGALRAVNWPEGLMAAVAVTAPRVVETVKVPIPERIPGHALVRVRYVGLCGTDVELWHGSATYLNDGRATFPHAIGHEWMGVVVAGEELVGQRVVGQTMVPCDRCVRCRSGGRALCRNMREVGLYGIQGAAAEYVRMPVSALVPVSDSVGDQEAVLVEPAVTVVEALHRGRCRLGDRVAVVGTGTIGLLATQLAARTASLVDAVGVDQAGLELAIELGAARGLAPYQAADASYSLVIEASGSPAGFRRALDLVEPGGRVAVVGVSSEPADDVPSARITLDGMSILGIRHGLTHYDHVLDLFDLGLLRPEPLIARTVPANRAAEAFEFAEHGRGARPKVILDFTDGADDTYGDRT